LSYTPAARQPSLPVVAIAAIGCETVTLTCSPSQSDWYWQTASGGTSTAPAGRSTAGYRVTVSGSYYLRAYNAETQCWSAALEKQVTVLRGPEAFALEGYDFCGANGGRVELERSETGVKYQLMSGSGAAGVALDGTGTALQWTGLSAADYWVSASSGDPQCSAEMSNRVRVRAMTDASVNFRVERILCAAKFTSESDLGSLGTAPFYTWEFGDAGTSNIISPVHAYARDGTYEATLTVSYYADCSGRNLAGCHCGERLSKRVSKQVTTASLPESESFTEKTFTYQAPIYEKVLSSSATSFHCAWPNWSSAENQSAYATGEDGVWRASGSYVYKSERVQSADVAPARDGTYTMEQFIWEAPGISPKWLKTEEVKEYSAFSKPLMAEDVLLVPSSALYDYGGYLQSAQGVNMKNREMAFTGFEYMDQYKPPGFEGRESGNWNFGTAPVRVNNIYGARGEGHYVETEAPLKKFENVSGVYVQGRYFSCAYPIFCPPVRSYGYQKIVCKQASADKKKTYLVTELPVCEGNHWEGSIIIPQTIRPSSPTPVFSPVKAHTGKLSLYISENTTFPQEIIKLDSGRSYSMSAWVSSQSPAAGIEVLFKEKNDTQVASFSCAPEGPAIEGWQQIRGTFVCPKNDMKVFLVFKNGGSAAYYDDLRLHPSEGNMESYVYDVGNYKLLAKLDAENFATLYYYDKEGQLRVTKKETSDGVKTLSEAADYVKKSQ